MFTRVNEKEGTLFINISDARQVRNLKPDERYCVVGTNGLMGQPYDMLEHRQDMCIRLNAWHGCDSWVMMNKNNINEMLNVMFEALDMIKKAV